MARMVASLALLLVSAELPLGALAVAAGTVGAQRERALVSTWSKVLGEERAQSLSHAQAKETPVTRVVNLLKEMQGTLKSEMDEDDELFTKLQCWCNNNGYSKTESIGSAEAKNAGLEAEIEALTAKGAELTNKLKETEEEVARDKADLAEATAIREKESEAFHGMEMDAVQAVENLKAAMAVLGKHKAGDTNWHSFLQTVTFPFESKTDRKLDRFMTNNGYGESSYATVTPAVSDGFLQHPAGDAAWTSDEHAIVKLGMKSTASFMQAHHEQTTHIVSGPGGGANYESRSGEILGIMAQVMEDMQAELSAEQKEESQKAAQFAELRNAKTAEIETGEKEAETKEDELAVTHNKLAEAKEDLGQTQATLAEDQKFLKNTKKTCSEAESAFEERKKSRLAEIEAVSETIEILMGDDARDAMTSTYNFMQVTSSKKADDRRKTAVQALRNAGAKLGAPQLSMLANQVELDAFTKVKKAIDDMISTLKTQTADEVKKNDWCKNELQENEMTTAKTDDTKKDEEAKIASLGSTIERLTEEIAAGKQEISDMQLSLQRASENRKMDNMEFQKTVADQAATIEVMELALNRLAKFYDKEFLLQKQTGKQTPDVVQMEYAPNKGSTGVMSMIEKLIYEAKQMMADSKKQEMEATTGYETLVTDTFATVFKLQKEVTTKTETKAKAGKDKLATEDDLTETVLELEALSKMNGEVHSECDYVLKNFMNRQEARQQEIEALQQAKQILGGANLS